MGAAPPQACRPAFPEPQPWQPRRPGPRAPAADRRRAARGAGTTSPPRAVRLPAHRWTCSTTPRRRSPQTPRRPAQPQPAPDNDGAPPDEDAQRTDQDPQPAPAPPEAEAPGTTAREPGDAGRGGAGLQRRSQSRVARPERPGYARGRRVSDRLTHLHHPAGSRLHPPPPTGPERPWRVTRSQAMSPTFGDLSPPWSPPGPACGAFGCGGGAGGRPRRRRARPLTVSTPSGRGARWA